MSCKGCDKRHIGCHAECEDYKALRREIEAKKEIIHKGRDLDRALEAMDYHRVQYAKKKKGER